MSLTVSFKNSFLPYAIKEWNKLVPEIRNAETYASFRIIFLNFKIRTGNTTYKIYDLLGIKLLPRLRLDIHRHNFADSLIPLCSCSLETECTLHFFSMLPKLYYFTQSPCDWFKKYLWYDYVFLNEIDLLLVIL